MSELEWLAKAMARESLLEWNERYFLAPRGSEERAVAGARMTAAHRACVQLGVLDMMMLGVLVPVE